MKLQEALEVMHINNDEFVQYDVFSLKKQYHKIALQVHPDKGGSDEEFQKLNIAYTNLNEIKLSSVNEKNIKEGDAFRYIEFLMFLLNNENLKSYVYGKCMLIVQNLLSELKTRYYHNFVKESNNKDTYHFNLHPSLEDIIENNIYKYNYKDTYFLIPLWHGEIHFEYENKLLVFICNPVIPNNYYIDKYNNTHIIVNYLFEDICNMENISINFGKNTLLVPVNELRIIKYQTYKFFKKGLSEINVTDMYNVSNKMDIYLHIYLNNK